MFWCIGIDLSKNSQPLCGPLRSVCEADPTYLTSNPAQTFLPSRTIIRDGAMMDEISTSRRGDEECPNLSVRTVGTGGPFRRPVFSPGARSLDRDGDVVGLRIWIVFQAVNRSREPAHHVARSTSVVAQPETVEIAARHPSFDAGFHCCAGCAPIWHVYRNSSAGLKAAARPLRWHPANCES